MSCLLALFCTLEPWLFYRGFLSHGPCVRQSWRPFWVTQAWTTKCRGSCRDDVCRHMFWSLEPSLSNRLRAEIPDMMADKRESCIRRLHCGRQSYALTQSEDLLCQIRMRCGRCFHSVETNRARPKSHHQCCIKDSFCIRSVIVTMQQCGCNILVRPRNNYCLHPKIKVVWMVKWYLKGFSHLLLKMPLNRDLWSGEAEPHSHHEM